VLHLFLTQRNFKAAETGENLFLLHSFKPRFKLPSAETCQGPNLVCNHLGPCHFR